MFLFCIWKNSNSGSLWGKRQLSSLKEFESKTEFCATSCKYVVLTVGSSAFSFSTGGKKEGGKKKQRQTARACRSSCCLQSKQTFEKIRIYLNLNESPYWCFRVTESFLIIIFLESNWKSSVLKPNVTHLDGTKHLILKNNITINASIFLWEYEQIRHNKWWKHY